MTLLARQLLAFLLLLQLVVSPLNGVLAGTHSGSNCATAQPQSGMIMAKDHEVHVPNPSDSPSYCHQQCSANHHCSFCLWLPSCSASTVSVTMPARLAEVGSVSFDAPPVDLLYRPPIV